MQTGARSVVKRRSQDVIVAAVTGPWKQAVTGVSLALYDSFGEAQSNVNRDLTSSGYKFLSVVWGVTTVCVHVSRSLAHPSFAVWLFGLGGSRRLASNLHGSCCVPTRDLGVCVCVCVYCPAQVAARLGRRVASCPSPSIR